MSKDTKNEPKITPELSYYMRRVALHGKTAVLADCSSNHNKLTGASYVARGLVEAYARDPASGDKLGAALEIFAKINDQLHEASVRWIADTELIARAAALVDMKISPGTAGEALFSTWATLNKDLLAEQMKTVVAVLTEIPVFPK